MESYVRRGGDRSRKGGRRTRDDNVGRDKDLERRGSLKLSKKLRERVSSWRGKERKAKEETRIPD